MTTNAQVLDDHTAGVVTIGGRAVRRMGFGAMRIAGARNADGARDRAEARVLVRRVIERGVNFIDTANIYAYGASEEIIAEALHPYPDDLLISTKAGFEPGRLQPGQDVLPALGRPDHIMEECDKSLRRLKLDVIDLYQVHVPDPDVPYEETLGAFVELQRLGKIRHIGVSNVTLDQLKVARSICDVVSVENRYSANTRESDAIMRYCEANAIVFIPWAPVIDAGSSADSAVRSVARSLGASPQQVGLAWLLSRSSCMLPIPGTSSITHLDENIDAAWIRLDDQQLAELDALTPSV